LQDRVLIEQYVGTRRIELMIFINRYDNDNG